MARNVQAFEALGLFWACATDFASTRYRLNLGISGAVWTRVAAHTPPLVRCSKESPLLGL